MRRLIVESPTAEVAKFLGVESALEKVESFEIISLLREEPEEWAIVCKAKMKEPSFKFTDALSDKLAEIQHLQTEKDGSQIYFIKRKPNHVVSSVFMAGGYFSLPLQIQGERMKASFTGTSQQIKHILGTISKLGLAYRVISVADARFSPTSPLGILTEKQRKVLTTAFNLGYYDIPKKTSNNEIAKKLNIKEPTCVRHRVKAEKRLLTALLSESL